MLNSGLGSVKFHKTEFGGETQEQQEPSLAQAFINLLLLPHITPFCVMQL